VLKQRAAGRMETQALLMPLILQLTAGQQIEYARIAGELQFIGFRGRGRRYQTYINEVLRHEMQTHSRGR